MKLAMFLGAACLSLTGTASAQSYTAVETTTPMVVGEVIRYEPGQVIVIRGGDSKEITYRLAPNIAVPAEVQVGRKVTLFTEAGTDGTTLVSRVTTTSVTPEGKVQKTTEETRRAPSGATSKVTTTTTTSGRVEAFIPGKTLTIQRTDGSRITYVINEQSQLPSDLVIGKSVTILPSTGSTDRIAKIVTYEVVPQQ